MGSPDGINFNNLFFGSQKGGMLGCGSTAMGENEYDGTPVDLGVNYTDTVEITSKPDAKPNETAADTHADTDTAPPDPCDFDNDGFLLAPYCGEGPYDCNDLSDKTYPGAEEVPCNGIDEDCDGKDLKDVDGDEVDGCYFSEPKDCDDKDKTIFPGAKEKTCDGVDQNCNGNHDEDWDCDGYTIDEGDCNDGESKINPGAKDKICDQDLNCDGKIDEKDVDKDGYGDCPWSEPKDCDDNNVNVHPGAEEVPCNDLDENCDGKALIETDSDGDGATLEGYCKPKDCDDGNSLRAPGLLETCDGIDNDCDNVIDEGCQPPPVCEEGETIASYSGPPATENVGICQPHIDICIDDNYVPLQEEVLPQTEVCNSLDDDCDNQTDEELTLKDYSGVEGKAGVGICKEEIKVCQNGVYSVAQEKVLPQSEIPCNDIDEDCDKAAFQGTDKDKDGYKLEGGLCGPVDCDDDDAQTYPEAVEACNGKDDNCGGQIDENLFQINYSGPAGTEGVGVCKPKIQKCLDGIFGVTQEEVVPQPEICNSLDDDCDGETDEDLILKDFSGVEGKAGTGICKEEIKVCQNGVYSVAQEKILPELEIPCNDIDEDCDGLDFPGTDLDEDGFTQEPECGLVDCDDTNPEINPLAKELCNGIDDNCNDQKDEGFNIGEPCEDGVGECKNYGNYICGPTGLITICDAEKLPSSDEICDGLDNDCDGETDEDLTLISYNGPQGTQNVGVCKPKIQECINGSYSTTQQQVIPQTETCNNLDDDCDNQKDEDLTQITYSGPPGTQNIGICKPKIQQCINGSYTTTQAEALPKTESCNNLDDNCDGQEDEGLTKTSYSGPLGTLNVGICKPKIEECINGSYSTTQQQVTPSVESCNNQDDDCDGQKDEDLTQITYSGPPGTQNIGICKTEIKVCQNGMLVITQAEVLPQNEICNGLDDNCDNAVDEPAILCACDPDGDGIITDKIVDPNFLAAVRTALKKGPNDDITLQDAINVTTLNLSWTNISNLSGLECFTNLTQLILHNNKISDISPIASLTNLTSLDLDSNLISDISPLSNLTNLTWLTLRDNQISDLSPLSELNNLTMLNAGSNQISNLAPLSGLTNLTELYLSTNQISNLSPLSNLIKLTSLHLSYNQITDLTPLSNLTSLTNLNLHYNQITDLTPLSKLISLTWLDLYSNQIKDITPLSKLNSLTELGLDANQIKDLTPLINLNSLIVLDLSTNQITNLTPLSKLTKLTNLYLGFNQITDLAPLSSLIKLAKLDIGWNKLTDASPLINNPGFGAGDNLCLQGNQIPAEQITALQNKGVDLCCPPWACP